VSLYDWENEGGMYDMYAFVSDGDDEGPVMLDVDNTPARTLAIIPHIHRLDGTCYKNRYDVECS
jgi:hypothetical protein